MSPIWTTFIYELANFVLLVLLLNWLFFKPVRSALDKHAAQQAAKAQEADAALAGAEKVKGDIDRQRQSLASEIQSERTKAIAAAEKEAQSILDRAKEEALRQQQLLERRRAAEKQTIANEMGEAVAAAAGEIVERLLKQVDGSNLDATLIRRVCDELKKLDADKLEPVVVETAHQVDSSLKQEIDAALGPAAASATFRTVESLGAGIRVRTASGIVDASAQGLARFAIERMNQQFHVSSNGNHC